MSTSPLSPQEIRAAAAAHKELGPEYSDAVVESFLERVDREITARVDARLGPVSREQPRRRVFNHETCHVESVLSLRATHLTPFLRAAARD